MSWLTLKLLSLIFQVLPFTIVVVSALDWLERCGSPPAALHLSCVCMLFGNTASLFMNTYFGHAMAATWILALSLCLLQRRYVLGGLAYGLALLSDYSSAVLFPAFLTAILFQEPKKHWFQCGWQITLGGMLPGTLWTIYHIVCFGGVLTLPSRYQNPEFVDTGRNAILGIFNLTPNPRVIAQLIFGFSRGIMYSQPWILLILSVVLFRRFLMKRNGAWSLCLPLWRFLWPGILLLLWMNASFGQWEGGYSPGPRYMCSLFPAIGLLTGLCYAHLSTQTRLLLVIGVGLAVTFWIVLYSTTALTPPAETLWGFSLQQLTDHSCKALTVFFILCAAFEWQLLSICRAGIKL